MKKLTALILAAGKGTRMKSELPKVLHRVCGQSLIARTMREVAALSPDEIILVLGHGKKEVEEEIALQKIFSAGKTKVVEQKEQNGTGHAVQIGLTGVSDTDSNILILPGDVPLLHAALLKNFMSESKKSSATISCLTAELADPTGYGRVVKDSAGNVLKIVEQKDASKAEQAINEINTSIYLADFSFLKDACARLRPNNAQGEFYLTDTIELASAGGKKVFAYAAANALHVSGANTKEELSMLEKERRKEINSTHMKNGVTMEDPENTYIDEDVLIAADVFLGAGVKLRGKTKIGKGSVIEGPCIIKDCSLGERVTIKLSCLLEEATIGNDCSVGPCAHIRPGSMLKDNVKIGNFVETKKVVLEAGVKANHLTYLGDAAIGENSNIGAGTITCNYDGKNKNQTTIGKNVFIGSNSCLVAPVSIEDEAYVGAGSVITKNVPGKALGIARAKQENLENWKRK